MNYAMSFIRPIHPQLEEVLIEVATSNKIRLNVAKGKEMIGQLRFYEIDEMELGESEEEEEQIEEGLDEEGQ